MIFDQRYYCFYVVFLWGLIANLSVVSGQQLARSADRLNYIAAAEIRSQPVEKLPSICGRKRKIKDRFATGIWR